MKDYIQSVFLFVVFSFCVQNAYGDCNDVFDILPNQLSVPENLTGEQFSIPYNVSEKWGMEVVKINGHTSVKRTLDFILSHFSLISNTVTERLSLSISKPLDLEDMIKYTRMVIGSIDLELTCDTYNKRQIKVIVIPVVEFPPEFKEKPYSISIPENQPVGTSIFNVSSKVQSSDVGGLNSFSFYIERYTTDLSVDGSSYFTIGYASSGIITVKKTVDYDALIQNRKPTYLILQLTALDQGASSLKSVTTLNVTITDDDDQGPLFSICSRPCRDSYRATTQTVYRGPMTVRPVPLSARDPDTFNNTIIYNLEPVAFNRDRVFSIDRLTGQISQIGDVVGTGILTIKATENSAKGLSEFTTLLVSLGNETTVTPPAGKSTQEDDSGNMKLILIIVGVLALILIVGLIIAFVIYHKKTSKAVQPADDGTDDSSISHSQNWQGSKTELLGNEMNPAMMATLQGRGGTLPPMTKDSATGTGKKRSRRRNKNKEPEIFDGTREYEGALDMDFFNDANTKSKIKQSTRSRDTKTDPKYWITITNDDD